MKKKVEGKKKNCFFVKLIEQYRKKEVCRQNSKCIRNEDCFLFFLDIRTFSNKKSKISSTIKIAKTRPDTKSVVIKIDTDKHRSLMTSSQ